ncbi:MAG: adenine phosphoribosyltransferase [Oribacterium sp.]|nr:adenine phosphoribosyltransferase [Oribacterium sp.]MBR1856379.1 adenine phosphoribosyltransferase [Oribacterium sp.]
MKREKLEDYVMTIPDFPEPGIMFRDITSLIQDPDGLHDAIDGLKNLLKDVKFDKVLGLESRGFIFGTPIAYEFKKGFVPVRKKGKLPRETVSAKYELEYGEAEIEIHKDSISKGEKVVIIDDLIATGGTLEASCKLVEELGGEVACIALVMELAGLEGRKKLEKYDVRTLITYEGK